MLPALTALPLPLIYHSAAACCYSMLNDEEDGLEALNAAMASGEPLQSTHCGAALHQ